jgi:hypothetical protein
MSTSLPHSSSLAASNALAVDARSLNALKTAAGENSPQAARETAKQLESLFMREMIKSMREATMKSGLLDSAQGNLSTDCWISSSRWPWRASPAASPMPSASSWRAAWGSTPPRTPKLPCLPP